MKRVKSKCNMKTSLNVIEAHYWILYVYASLSLSVWRACWPPVNTIHAKHSLYWGRSGLAPHPFLAIISFSWKQCSYTFIHNPLCVECVYVVLYRICKMICKGKEKYLFAISGQAGSVPRPLPPPPLCGVSGWGRGGGPGLAWGFWAGKGGSLASQYRELQWRLFLGSKIRGLESHLNPASCHGGSFWRVISTGDSGTFIWRVFMASKFSEYSVGSKESKAKKRKVNCVYSVDL
jgi:hypothetical protein